MTPRLVRTLPAFAPRPAFERTDARLDPITSVAFVPGTTDVIAIGRFGIQRFALERDEPVWRVPADGLWQTAIALSPDGERLLTIGDDDRLVERDAYTGIARWCWADRRYHTDALAFSADGAEVVWCGSRVAGNPSGYSVPAVDLFETATMAQRWRWKGESWHLAHGAVFVPRGVLVAHSNGSLEILDRATGAPVAGVPHRGTLLRASRDGRTLIVDDWRLVALRDDEVIGEVGASCEPVAIDPDGRYAVIAPGWQTIEIIALDSVRVVASLTFPDEDLDRVTGLACSERGLVAVGTNGGHTFVYELT